MGGGDERPVQTIDPDSDTIHVRLTLPEGYKFLPDGQHMVTLHSSDSEILWVHPFDLPDLTFDYLVPIEVRKEGEAVLHLEAMVFFCPVSDESICMFAACDEEFPIRVEPGGKGVELLHEIQPMV